MNLFVELVHESKLILAAVLITLAMVRLEREMHDRDLYTLYTDENGYKGSVFDKRTGTLWSRFKDTKTDEWFWDKSFSPNEYLD